MDRTHPLVAGELERIKRADAPLRERSRCLTLVRTKVSYRTLHPEHLPQVLPLSDPCLLFSPTRRRGRGMSRETSLLSPSLIPRPRWARTPGCSGSYLDFIESLIQVFQQISLVRLKHHHSVQRSDDLTCCCICPAI